MIHTKQSLPCGSWPSPFTTTFVTGKNKHFGELTKDQENLYWLERRPEEAGRTVLVKWDRLTETQKDITPSPFSVGNQVHEYGGGSYAVKNGIVIFSDSKTNGLWLLRPDQEEIQLLYQDNQTRFADFCLTDTHVICVCEEHSQKPVKNSLVLLPLDQPQTKHILAEGADFYSSPCLSNDYQQLAWIEWDHPFMPWESTRLCKAVLDLKTHKLGEKHILAGHKQQESLIQPGWTEQDHLFVCSDRNEYWNLYQVDLSQPTNPDLKPIAAIAAETGQAQWVFGQKDWHACSDTHFIVRAIRQGQTEILNIQQDNVQKMEFASPATCPLPFEDNGFAWINASPYQPSEIIYQDSQGKRHILASATSIIMPHSMISKGEAIAFPTRDGQQAYGFFYPPTHTDYQPTDKELPPLLVIAHGGPTGQNENVYSPRIQFWTSRGFAVVDVNYRGSTGFGKTYRNALQKQWGVLDVQDCIDACTYLIEQKKVNPEKIVIRGSSAGGFTVLKALTESSLFAAGSCLYGVGDLTDLAKETHKFESHYLEGLIGAYPEEAHLYKERSPLTHLHKIQCPLIVFQGLKDKVVPPAQAEKIVQHLKKNHVPYAYYTFPEEGHGFKQPETLKKVLKLELAFFGKILGFTPYEAIEFDFP